MKIKTLMQNICKNSNYLIFNNGNITIIRVKRLGVFYGQFIWKIEPILKLNQSNSYCSIN